MKILDMWDHLIRGVQQQSTKNLFERTIAYNKHIAHVFALPVVTPTFGSICWTIQEIENLDIIPRKILNMTGNLHRY